LCRYWGSTACMY